MAIEKIPIMTSKDAEELCAVLHLFHYKPSRADVPGVWIVRAPESDDEIGEILAIVTFTDFYGDDIFHKARQVLELLNGSRYDVTGIPPEDYQIIEKALRDTNYYAEKVGDYYVDAEDNARKLESKYNAMIDMKMIRYLEQNPTTGPTIAKTHARIMCAEYLNNWNEAKRTRDHAKNLYYALKSTGNTYRTIFAKLRREFEDINK